MAIFALKFNLSELSPCNPIYAVIISNFWEQISFLGNNTLDNMLSN